MIISKPQTSTLFSFTLFLIISLGLIGFNLNAILTSESANWLNYAVVVLLGIISAIVFYRIFISYKIVSLGNDQITIRYPVLNRTRSFQLTQLLTWKENIVKTGKTRTYQELEVLFEGHFKLAMGSREYSSYPAVITYLSKKAKAKKHQN